MRRIGLVDLVAELNERGAALVSGIEQLARTGQFVQGPAVASFERALAERCGLQHAVGVGSGTDALVLALRAAGVSSGDVVVTSPLSFIATAEAVVRVGARPCFVDVEPHSLCLCPRQVAAYLASCERTADGALCDPSSGARVTAILPVHLFGRVADVAALWNQAAEHGLRVVEDAAQAVGARCEETALGRRGPVCLSFFPTKNLGAWGDGGAVLTDDEELAARVRSLGRHGVTSAGTYEALGCNSRLDALQAGLLEQKLGFLAEDNARRRAHAGNYRQALSAAGLAERVQLPPPFRAGDIVHQFTIRVSGGASDRDRLREHLDHAGIQTGTYYARLLCDQPAISATAIVAGSLATARAAADSVLSLPVHPFLSAADVERVVNAIVAFYAT